MATGTTASRFPTSLERTNLIDVLLIDHIKFVAPRRTANSEHRSPHVLNPAAAQLGILQGLEFLVSRRTVELKHHAAGRVDARFGDELTVGLAKFTFIR